MNKKIVSAALLLIPSMAFAHPGHGDGFAAAFAHPFTGIDHLLMMLCVGIFAGRIGGNARWQLPLAFFGAMTAGWLLAASGIFIAGIESGIAAGLIALGVLFAWRMTLPFAMQASIVAMFAVLHGMAHGSELSSATPIATALGFLLATAALHGVGLGIAEWVPREKQGIYRALGALLAIIGGGLLSIA